MKTVAQWAEQLPELIKIEFLIVNDKRLNDELRNLHLALRTTSWIDKKTKANFWCGVYETVLIDPTSADYIDEKTSYTKEEVEAMILEFADPNDEVCKVMLANLFDNQIKDVEQNLEDNFKPLHDNQTTVDYDFARRTPDLNGVIEQDKKERELYFWEQTSKQYSGRIDALKREVEAGKEKIKKLLDEQFEEYKKHRGVVFRMNDEIVAKNETIRLQEETIKTLTQMRVAPKKEQSIFFDLLEHIGLRK